MRITPDKEEVTTTIWGLTRGWFWLGMFMITIFAVGTGVMMTKPYWLGLERKAFVASHQYVESRRTELVQMHTQITGIDRSIARPGLSAQLKQSLGAQRLAIIARMRNAAAEIPEDSIPPVVVRFLARN